MIDKKRDPEAWAMFTYELADAAEHLSTLLQEMEQDGYEEADFRIGLGHIYAHLNRAWHSRNSDASSALDLSESLRQAWTQFPTDLTPVG